MRPFDLALRLVGVQEIPGATHHPAVQWAHMLCGLGAEQPDETPWCSSFMNLVCHLTGYERTGAANARSWLTVGKEIGLPDAIQGTDAVVFWRGEKNGWQGHVGLFAGQKDDGHLWVLGGNQGNQVGIDSYPVERLLGVRRLSRI